MGACGSLWEQPAQPLEIHMASRHLLDSVFSYFPEHLVSYPSLKLANPESEYCPFGVYPSDYWNAWRDAYPEFTKVTVLCLKLFVNTLAHLVEYGLGLPSETWWQGHGRGGTVYGSH